MIDSPSLEPLHYSGSRDFLTVESKQLWQNRESHSEVCMCGMLTQQWPSTQITLFERTRQSAWLDAETTSVNQKRVNYCIFKHFLFWESSATKKIAQKPRKCSLRHATDVKFSEFRWRRKKKKPRLWTRALCGYNSWINSGPKILRRCLLHCESATPEYHWCSQSSCPNVCIWANQLCSRQPQIRRRNRLLHQAQKAWCTRCRKRQTLRRSCDTGMWRARSVDPLFSLASARTREAKHIWIEE